MVNYTGKADRPILHRSKDVFNPQTNEERDEVRRQLQNILENPVFHNSKRYSAVLKYLVDRTLEGRGDQLKERTIGIEVFNRAPDYDTAADHAVRSAVAEVRKRLAQYYQQAEGSKVKIEVSPGSYVPQFRWAEEQFSLSSSASHRDQNQTGDALASPSADRVSRHAWLRVEWFTAMCLILLAFLAALLVGSARKQDAFDSFWKPILSSHAPVLLCIGDVEGGQALPGQNSNLDPKLSLREFHNSPFETVNAYDVITMTKFAGLMQVRGRQFELKSQSDATFTDLQNGPTILVGLLNNNWTERLMPKLRFTVEQDADKVTILDSNNPSRHDWSVDYTTPYMDVTRDYALVLRMLDPKTEQTVVVAAGITVFGTYAAGNLLTNRSEMKKLAAIAPSGWEGKNMEIVLSTDVIRGRSGPATIVAAQFW
ncbi:MAG: hypothetical protein ABSF70_02840 [Terracidiphilus sp.]|jgi:hypothetical protein